MRITLKAALISALISGLISLIGVSVNYQSAKKANEIAQTALDESKKTVAFYNDISKQKDIPRLEAYPISVGFYTPDKPEAAGQVRIHIGTIIKNLSEANAKHISLNLETKDWYGHCTNWFEVYKSYKFPIPKITSLAKNADLIFPSYTPDAPSSGEAGYVSQEEPFVLKITLSWQDNNNREYVYVAFYKLEYSRLADKVFLYFSKIEDYDSVLNSQKALEYANKSLKEYKFIKKTD